MNISLNCNISLSKKLRSLLGTGGSITLIAPELQDGKGMGVLSLSGENIKFDGNKIEGETSIQLEQVGDMKLEVGGDDQSCTNLFSSIPRKGHSEKVVSKIAVVNAPEKCEVQTAIKTKKQIQTEASISKSIPSPSCAKWIESMEQLMQTLKDSKIRRSELDVDSAKTDRERALLIEAKEKEESIDTPAWVVNNKYGNLAVNDLGIALPMNIPYDLSNISAFRLAASRDLKSLIKGGFISFISPDDCKKYLDEIVNQESPDSLPVYDRHEEAEEAMTGDTNEEGNPVIGVEAMELTSSDLEKSTEEENTIINLTQNMPTVKKPVIPSPSTDQPRHTVHGNDPMSPKVAHKTVIRRE